MFRKSVRKMWLGVVLAAAIVIMTVALVAAPQSAAVACGVGGGSCFCPGC
jgi:hypothetical protein